MTPGVSHFFSLVGRVHIAEEYHKFRSSRVISATNHCSRRGRPVSVSGLQLGIADYSRTIGLECQRDAPQHLELTDHNARDQMLPLTSVFGAPKPTTTPLRGSRGFVCWLAQSSPG